MRLDETQTPRHVCRVPANDTRRRTCVTRLPSKKAIERYAETLRDALPPGGHHFMFHAGPHRVSN